jgi:alpha-L-fucosidase
MKKIIILVVLMIPLFSFGQEKKYEPNWESLNSRPIPAWFPDAKFGIFIHWGPYSVPAWAPKGVYEEWYQNWLTTKKVSGNNNPSPTAVYDHHVSKYGKDFSYYNFGEMFKAEDFKPEEWAKLFVDAGAKYIVLTSKHHDGFALWPSKEADKTWGFSWNSLSSGPKRDLVGDLAREVRKTDVKFGLYYSLYEWYNPLWLSDKKRFVDEHFLPQVKDLVNSYKPDILWADGDWEIDASEWKAPELIAWLYNESPVKDKILINNRWGKDARKAPGTYRTSEFGGSSAGIKGLWEENRGIGFSFGYNRNEDLSDYSSAQTLILLLVDVVSHGGNLLLDIGPDGTGKIPPIMQERLLQIGEWLKTNGEAIYGTSQWNIPVQWSDGKIMEAAEYKKINNIRYLGGDFILKQTLKPDPGMAVKEIFFTRKGSTVYAILPKLPDNQLKINVMPVSKDTRISLIGFNSNLKWKKVGTGIMINFPVISVNALPVQNAWVLKITNVTENL